MEKQEKAFTVWANSVLRPLDVDLLQTHTSLSDGRMAARVRAMLWRLYSEDEGVISTMVRLEERIDGGHLRLKHEVGSFLEEALFKPPPHPPPLGTPLPSP